MLNLSVNYFPAMQFLYHAIKKQVLLRWGEKEVTKILRWHFSLALRMMDEVGTFEIALSNSLHHLMDFLMADSWTL